MFDWKWGQYRDIQHVNVKTLIQSDGETALMAAAYSGHLETVKFLIEHGANIEAKHK